MIMLVPYVRVDEKTYRRLEWSFDKHRAEHTIRQAVSKQVNRPVRIETITKPDGSFVRTTKGDIILFDMDTYKRCGYIKEIRCQTLKRQTI